MNSIASKCDLESPTRNNYFYGKRLDTFHFQLETDYFNGKRSLVNRCVHGTGVVCGLNVTPCSENSVLIHPGLAIDCEGREIVVPEPYKLMLTLDPSDSEHCPEEEIEENESEKDEVQSKDPHRRKREGDYGNETRMKWFKVFLCYKECLDKPEAVNTSDHCDATSVQPSTIEESFEVCAESGKFESPCDWLKIPDVIKEIRGSKGSTPQRAYEICYHTLVKNVVSQPCCKEANSWDPCIPLANICMVRDGKTWRIGDNGIDILVRPIVLSNDNLFQLILSLILDR